MNTPKNRSFELGRIDVKVGEHRHQIKNAILTVEYERSLDACFIRIHGDTFSQIPTELKVGVGQIDIKALSTALEEHRIYTEDVYRRMFD